MKKRKHRRPRYSRGLLAYHEAGHAVAAYELGITVFGIDMIGGGMYRAGVAFEKEAWEKAGSNRATVARGLHRFLVMSLAGIVAQRLAGYTNEAGVSSDIVDAIGYADRLACIEAGLPDDDQWKEGFEDDDPLSATADIIRGRALVEAEILLKANWSAVERVASLLSKYDELTGEELQTVISLAKAARLRS